jgi:hypothetical protein
MKTKIKVPRHPVFKSFGVFNTISGTYVCPGWIKVPSGTTIDDIELCDDISIEPEVNLAGVKPEPIEVKDIEHRVTASNGKSEYIVSFKKGSWNCTCPAANFRRGDCKHIKMFK